MFKRGEKVLESFPSTICGILNLPAAECVALACSLTQSQFKIYGTDSFRVMKIKLPEITSFESIAAIHKDVMQFIVQSVLNSEVFSFLFLFLFSLYDYKCISLPLVLVF
jgi:hypothetical protein